MSLTATAPPRRSGEAGSGDPGFGDTGPEQSRGIGREAPGHRSIRGLAIVVDLIGLTAVVLLVGARAKAFAGFPSGYDALGHLAKIRLLEHDWPNVGWNTAWYSGSPYFAGSYPPGYHALVILVARAARLSDPRAMMTVAAGSAIAIVLGAYLTAWFATGRRAAGWLAGILVVSSGFLWAHILEHGLYPRLAALAGVSLALAAAVALTKRPTRTRTVAVIVALAWALACHLFVGVAGVAFVGLVLICGASGARLCRRVARAAGVITAALCLDGFFYLPLAKFTSGASQVSSHGSPAPWGVLAWPLSLANHQIDAFPIGLLALIVGVAAISLRQFRRIRGWPFSWERDEHAVLLARWHAGTLAHNVAVGLGVGAAGCFVYSYAGHIKKFPFYVLGMDPKDMLVFPAFLLAIAAAILACDAARQASRRVGRLVRTGAAVAAATSLIWCITIAPTARSVYTEPLDSTRHLLPDNLLAVGAGQFRVGGLNEKVTESLNVHDPVPQIRGYQANAIANLDWQYLLEDALSNAKTTPATLDATLDWWAIRWVEDGPHASQHTRYSSRPDAFKLLVSDKTADYTAFEVSRPTPIIAASAAPVVEFVGSDANYQLWFRLFAGNGDGPSKVTLLRGPVSLGALTSANLAGVDSVIGDGFSGPQLVRAAPALNRWVSAGGRLLLEAGNSQPLTNLPDPYPVAATTLSNVEQTWSFAPTAELSAANLGAFAPPNYNNTGSWQISKPEAIKPWAHAILSSSAAPLVVRGAVGAGTVTWSGMNLAYHAVSSTNSDERAVAAGLAGIAPQSAAAPMAGGRVTDDQHFSARAAPGAKGVLVKETFGIDWVASLDGRPASIRPAGPGFMWVAVPPDGRPHDVRFSYQTSALEHAGNALSVMTVAFILVFWVVPKRRWRLGLRRQP